VESASSGLGPRDFRSLDESLERGGESERNGRVYSVSETGGTYDSPEQEFGQDRAFPEPSRDFQIKNKKEERSRRATKDRISMKGRAPDNYQEEGRLAGRQGSSIV